MDNPIASYISEVFTPEQKENLLNSFQLFEDFELKNYEEDFIGIIMMESYHHTEDILNFFYELLNEKLDYILSEHRLKVSSDCSISFKNELLRGLNRILSLEDYTPILRVLESLETNESKFSSILSDITSLSEVEILENVVEISPVMLTSLKSYALVKDKKENDIPSQDLIEKTSAFFNCFERDSIGKQLVSVILLGQKFKDYLPFIKDEILSGSEEDVAFNILSVMVFSKDCYNDFISGFRNNSSLLFDDIRKSTILDQYIIKFSGMFNEFWSIQIEKNRLLKAST